ncbi:MAG: beta-lactamase family protein [Actinobacteria bacterium]|jgi:CubicO group peptidase (beta-lactamase class C family)|nr:beta-lactamase family protein [Actinomycetota bacterium]
MARVEGYANNQFQEVVQAFKSNFDNHGDVGASLCIYKDGAVVVDLWGGYNGYAPYGSDTLQLIFSATKGITTTAALILVDRSELDLDVPVKEYWPEFAKAGKDRITTRWLLSHRAGLPYVDAHLDLEEVISWTPVIEALAEQAPLWEPGSGHGYHALTFGWLVGEVLRRVSGMSVSELISKEIASPLNLDLWIGLPSSLEPRVAPLLPPRLELPDGFGQSVNQLINSFLGPESVLGKALSLSGALPLNMERFPWNDSKLHEAQLPAASGITNARSLARMYASVIGEVEGIRLVSPRTMEMARQVHSDGPDRVLVVPTRFGAGYMLDSAFQPLLGQGSFGHPGAGGSLGFADPEAGISFAYVMNQMQINLSGDPRTQSLVEALRHCLS